MCKVCPHSGKKSFLVSREAYFAVVTAFDEVQHIIKMLT